MLRHNLKWLESARIHDILHDRGSDSRWQDTPLLALSSHTSQQDMDRGRAVGFNDYVAMNDRNALLAALEETLTDIRGAA